MPQDQQLHVLGRVTAQSPHHRIHRARVNVYINDQITADRSAHDPAIAAGKPAVHRPNRGSETPQARRADKPALHVS
jgi:hypothetical protein